MNDLVVCEELFSSREVYVGLLKRLKSERVSYHSTSQLSQGVDGILVTDMDSQDCRHLSAANRICHIDFILLYLNDYVSSGAKALFRFPEENGYYRSMALDGVSVYLTGFNRDEARRQVYMRMIAEMGGTLLVSRFPQRWPTNAPAQARHGVEGAPRRRTDLGEPEPAPELASGLEDHGFFQLLENLSREDLALRREAMGRSDTSSGPAATRFLVVVGCAQCLRGLLAREWAEDRWELLAFFFSKIVDPSLIDYLYNQGFVGGADLTGERARPISVVTSGIPRGIAVSGIRLDRARLTSYRMRPLQGMRVCIPESDSGEVFGEGQAPVDVALGQTGFADQLDDWSDWKQCQQMCEDMGAEVVRPSPFQIPRIRVSSERELSEFYALRCEHGEGSYRYDVLVPRKAFAVLPASRGRLGGPDGPGDPGDPSAHKGGGQARGGDAYRLSGHGDAAQSSSWNSVPGRERWLSIHTHTRETLRWLSNFHASQELAGPLPSRDRGRTGASSEPSLKARLSELTGNYRLMLQVLYCKPLYVCIYGFDDIAGSRREFRRFLEERLLFPTIVDKFIQGGGETAAGEPVAEPRTKRHGVDVELDAGMDAESGAYGAHGTSGARPHPTRAPQGVSGELGAPGSSPGSGTAPPRPEATKEESAALDYLLDCIGVLPASALERLGPALRRRLFIVADVSLYFNRALVALQARDPDSRRLFRSQAMLGAALPSPPSPLFTRGGATSGEAFYADACKKLIERARAASAEVTELQKSGYNVRTGLWLQLLFEVAVFCHGGPWIQTELPSGQEAGLAPPAPRLHPTLFPAPEFSSAALAEVAVAGWRIMAINHLKADGLNDVEKRCFRLSRESFCTLIRAENSADSGDAGVSEDSRGLLRGIVDREQSCDRLRHSYLACLDLIPCDAGMAGRLGVTPRPALTAEEDQSISEGERKPLPLPEFASSMIKFLGDFSQSEAVSSGLRRTTQLQNEKPGEANLDFTNPTTDPEVIGSYMESRSAAQKSSAVSIFDYWADNYASDGTSAGDARYVRKQG